MFFFMDFGICVKKSVTDYSTILQHYVIFFPTSHNAADRQEAAMQSLAGRDRMFRHVMKDYLAAMPRTGFSNVCGAAGAGATRDDDGLCVRLSVSSPKSIIVRFVHQSSYQSSYQ